MKTRLLAPIALLIPMAVSAQAFTESGASLLGGLSINARSASLGDYDGDGDLDILTQGNGTAARRLLRNELIPSGSLSFTDVTSAAGPFAVDPSGWSAAWGDYNGDGHMDIFFGQTNSNLIGDLFRNNGNGTFTDVSSSTIPDPGFHQNVAWMDADLDGDLDLLIAMEGPELHQLYIQNPDGSFTPVGAQVGIQEYFGTKAYGTAIGDYDGDGDFDIYISTCRGEGNIPNNLYKNMLKEQGILRFVDIANTSGTQFMDNSYHAEFVDLDDDGDLDLLMIGADQKESKIFRNDGGDEFTDVSTLIGKPVLPSFGGDYNGGRAVDYDNDGDLDIFVHDNLRRTGAPFVPSNTARALFRNDGNWQFVDVTVAEGLHSTNEGAYDSAWGDVDNDGDMDLFAPTTTGIPERLFISNASTNGNSWLHVRLRQRGMNSTAIGASILATIHAGTPQERTLRREANTNAGTFNQSDLPVHFGLGTATRIDRLEIWWPDGRRQVIEDEAGSTLMEPLNRTIEITEPSMVDRWIIR